MGLPGIAVVTANLQFEDACPSSSTDVHEHDTILGAGRPTRRPGKHASAVRVLWRYNRLFPYLFSSCRVNVSSLRPAAGIPGGSE